MGPLRTGQNPIGGRKLDDMDLATSDPLPTAYFYAQNLPLNPDPDCVYSADLLGLQASFASPAVRECQRRHPQASDNSNNQTDGSDVRFLDVWKMVL